MKVLIFVLVILINLYTTWGQDLSIISKSAEDVHFYLYPDNKNIDKSQEIVYRDTKSLEKAKFVKNTLIRIFVSGFTTNLTTGGCVQIKGAFLHRGYSNIMCVDWSKLAGPNTNIISITNPVSYALYPVAVKNTITVGNRVGDFLIFLMKNKVASSGNSFQLIGHSLGSHIIGIAGRRVFERTGKKVGWITGLDPAGPLYKIVPNRFQLSKNSAKFVDTLHTDVDLFGTRRSLGTISFYANGGRGSEQKGCPPLDLTNLEDAGSILFCPHSLAIIDYERAILGEKLRGCKCNYLSFISIITPACAKPNPCIKTQQFGPLVSHSGKGNYFLAVPKDAPRKIKKDQIPLN